MTFNMVLTVWQKVEDAIQATVHTLENTFKFVVRTIEDAAHVVLGFLKSVLADVVNIIEKILEALSWLFHWHDILATHEHITSIVNEGFDEMITMVGQIRSESDGFFDSLKSTITTDFSTLITQVTGTTLGGTTQNYSDPSQAYGQGSSHYSVQSNWLYHKAMTGALGTNGSISLGSTSTLMALQNAQQSLASAMVTFLETVGQDALAIAEDLGQLVLDAVQELVKVLMDPNSTRGASLADLLGKLEDLLVDLVQLGKDVADGFFTLVITVASIIQQTLSTPIDIPVVSKLYSLITDGGDLTILDLFALVVAVPVTVIYKAKTGQAPFTSAIESDRALLGAGALNVENMITTFSSLVYAFVDPISDLMGDDSPAFLNYVEAVLMAINQATGIPLDDNGNQACDLSLLWLYEWYPVLWAVYSGLEKSAGNPTSNVVLPFHGIGSAIWQGVYAIMYPSLFFDSGIKLTQNELGALSTIAGFAKLSNNPDALMVLAAACFFLDQGNALIELKYW